MHSRWNRPLVAVWLVMVGSSEPGCSHDSGGSSSADTHGGEVVEDHEGEVLMEACEHMAEGPAREVRAGPWNDDNPPSVGTPHTRYDVVLGEVDGGHGGDLSYPVTRPGVLWLALSADLPVTVLRRTDGRALSVQEDVSGSRIPCEEVVRALSFPVEVGTLVIRIGAASVERVSLVLENLGEDHDHEHEHQD